MPTSGESGLDLPVDTSVAIALVVSDHAHHAPTFEAMADRRLGLAGHAAFETFSVLTRLSPPARRTTAAVARILVGLPGHQVPQRGGGGRTARAPRIERNRGRVGLRRSGRCCRGGARSPAGHPRSPGGRDLSQARCPRRAAGVMGRHQSEIRRGRTRLEPCPVSRRWWCQPAPRRSATKR